MKIGELSERSGLSRHTIRYYEKIGLLPNVERDQSRHRDYDPSILVWIEFLGRLKTTGMPIRNMLRYAELRARGAETENERYEMLVRHRDRVRTDIAERQTCLVVLDTKIAGYAGSTKRMKDHDASGPSPSRNPIRTGKTGSF
jgi:DNA-binding transcriptional MerR regulator